MASPLVAINEGMIDDDRDAQRCSLICCRGVQVMAFERDPRLRHRGDEPTKVTNSRATHRLLHDPAVELQNFRQRQVAHYANRR